MSAFDHPALRPDRVVTLAVGDRLSAFRRPLPRRRIPVLMYHSISGSASVPGAADGGAAAAALARDRRRRPYYRTITTPETFRHHMEFLAREGYRVIPLAQAVELLGALPADGPTSGGGVGAGEPPLAVITFDDGLADFQAHAYPVLRSFGFPATVFLATGYLGGNFLTGQPCLRPSEIRRLASSGVDFGSHTVTHPQLQRLSAADVQREVLESRRAIERLCGCSTALFSYPYRFPEEDRLFVAALRDALRQAGYCGGVTTTIGLASSDDEPLFLKRLPVNDLDDERLFAAKLRGGYDWLHAVQRLSKQLRRWRGPAP